jgi:hypothetical protein
LADWFLILNADMEIDYGINWFGKCLEKEIITGKSLLLFRE